MKMGLCRLISRWNCRLIDGNPFALVTLCTPLPRVHLTGRYLCMYIIQTPVFFIGTVQKGLQGLKPHKYSIFRGYHKKLPMVTRHAKGLR